MAGQKEWEVVRASNTGLDITLHRTTPTRGRTLSNVVIDDEQSLQQPAEKASTSKSSSFIKINSDKKSKNLSRRSTSRKRIHNRKYFAPSSEYLTGEQELAQASEQTPNSTFPSSDPSKIGNSNKAGFRRVIRRGGSQHGKDPSLTGLCLCGLNFCHNPIRLYYHIHYHDKVKNRRHPCKICGRSFMLTSALRLHSKLAHGQGLGPGRRLTLSTEQSQSQQHGPGKQELDEQGKIQYFCKCGTSYNQKYWLNAHILGNSPEKGFGCELCPRQFHFHFQLKKHMVHHHRMVGFAKGKIFSCPECAQLFATRKLLREHNKVIHKQ